LGLISSSPLRPHREFAGSECRWRSCRRCQGLCGNFVYLSATLEAAIWGAELAVGDGRGRIYVVEPTGSIEDDPNLTNKRFPGNPTKSYRSREPFRVVGEVTEWQGHSAERLQEMRDHLESLKQRGVEAIEE
jgi:hypothetical protein